MQRRIDVLTARLRETERKLEEATAAKAEAPKPPEPTEARPVKPDEYGSDPEVQGFNNQLAKWRRLETWLAKHPDGGEMTNEQGEVIQVINPDEAAQLRAEVWDITAEVRAQRAARVRELRAVDAAKRAEAEKSFLAFPWASDPRSLQNQFIGEIESAVPEIKRLPGWKLYAAHAIDSMTRQRTNGAAKPGAPAPAGKATKPPRVPVPTGASSTVRVDPIKQQLAAAEAAFEQSGSTEDFTRVNKLRRQLRAQQARA